MPDTSQDQNPSQKPRHPATEQTMAITVRDHPKKGIPRRGLVQINALAFNTLLSSQETRAHNDRNKPVAGATLKPYSGVSYMSTKFPEAFPGCCIYRDPPITRS